MVAWLNDKNVQGFHSLSLSNQISNMTDKTIVDKSSNCIFVLDEVHNVDIQKMQKNKVFMVLSFVF